MFSVLFFILLIYNFLMELRKRGNRKERGKEERGGDREEERAKHRRKGKKENERNRKERIGR